MTPLSFPPLFEGMATLGADPFTVACARAKTGCDAGLVTYDMRPDRLCAAIVFAPEITLEAAMIMLPLCGIGFQNALGALAPPEVSVHLGWSGNIRVNGGTCGTLCVAASTPDPDAIPDWLVVGLDLALWPADEEGGNTPDHTALFAEGCADVEAPGLLEAWVRHTLAWINSWEEDGKRVVHHEWQGLAHGIGEQAEINGQSGTFAGVDENFGMLLRMDDQTAIIPLTSTLIGGP